MAPVSYTHLIAASWGVSEAIIGVTIVAIGTSLPELVTAVTSLIKKQSSMSVGNVIGANVIDTTLILAVCSFVYGGKLPVSAQNIYLDSVSYTHLDVYKRQVMALVR